MRSIATAWQLGASVVFCAIFFQDQHFVSGFVPRLSLRGGLDFWLKRRAEMCVTEFGVCWRPAHLTCPTRKRGDLFLRAPEREVGGLPGSGLTGPCAQEHTHVMDTKDKLNYPSCCWTQGRQLLNAHHPLSKQTPWTAHSPFQLDWQTRMTVSSTPRCPILCSQRLSVTQRLLRARR